jgi:hypothetical protein
MPNDLLDAQAAVDWAIAQIPILQERFLAWQRNRPYELVVEPDSDPGYEILVAHQKRPVDPLVIGDAGAIINSARSSLDLLAAALATRNGVKPSHETHFPIFRSEQDMIDPLEGIEGKKWLSRSEQMTIKALHPYQGGDRFLWPLHRLDILRKHERLIAVQPGISEAWIARFPGVQGVRRTSVHFDEKTPLWRFPASSFRPTPGNTNVTAEISFTEAAALGAVREPVIPTLYEFVARIVEIIGLFNAP